MGGGRAEDPPVAPPVVWSGAGLVVVDKPAGQASEPTRARDGRDVVSTMQASYPGATAAHRLDTPVSGLLLMVVDRARHADVARAFADRTLRRTYLAVLAGDTLRAGSEVVWDLPLDGRAARSHVAVVGAVSGLLAVRLTLETGRTHQLRRHAAAAGLPIVGDRRHGGAVGGWAARVMLHATALHLPPRLTGTPDGETLTAPCPDAMAAWWQRAGGTTTETMPSR